jgi:prepilin-type N-terminal cleavage/methylation domain-containing protein
MDMKENEGFTLIELMIVIAIIAVIAAIAIPAIKSATRTSNERNASGSMKQLSSIQMTFKTTDSDANGQADYWVGDVSGLYLIASGNTYTNEGIKLLEPAVASADANSRARAGATQYGGVDFSSITSLSNMGPKAGYWFRVLTNYETGSGSTIYDAGSGKNSDKFGVIAVPAGYGSSGTALFILGEVGTQFKKDAGTQTGAGGSTGVGLNPGCWLAAAIPAPGPLASYSVGTSCVSIYPLDPLVTNGWSKMD